MGLGLMVVIDLQGDQILVAGSDPGRGVVGEGSFCTFWEVIRGALESFEKLLSGECATPSD